MSIYQTMQAVNNLTLNTNGAQAFTTTTDPVLDMFTLCSKDPYLTEDKYSELYALFCKVCDKNPEALLQLMTFHRSITKGNGIKHYYYLGMSILQKCCVDTELFKEMVRFSYQYTKDLYHLGTEGLDIYAEKIIEQLFSILSPEKQDIRFDPMLFKYLAYEDGHWKHHKKTIQTKLEDLIRIRIDEFICLVKSTEIYEKDALQKRVRSSLIDLFSEVDTMNPVFTNKRMRVMKTIFNKENHLPEYLLSGYHYDSTPLDDRVENGWFLQKSVEHIAKDISQTSGLATSALCKTIHTIQKVKNEFLNKKNTEQIPDTYGNRHDAGYGSTSRRKMKNEPVVDTLVPIEILPLRKQLLIAGYLKYKENLVKGTVVAKEVGVDLAQLAYNYFDTYDDSSGLESQLLARVDRLKEQWLPMFDETYTLEMFCSELRIIVDMSGSMRGIPLATGCLYLLLLARIFRIKEIVYFESNIKIIKLTDGDIDGPILNLLRKIYVREDGSTNLNAAFEYFEKNGLGNKKVVIITDSDCNPTVNGTESAFLNAFNPNNLFLPTNQYIVMNVKEPLMNFPFLGFHEKVCYVSGTSTIVFLIEALLECTRRNIPLTPGLVLQCCLSSKNFKLPESIIDGMRDSSRFSLKSVGLTPTVDELYELYNSWVSSLPIKRRSIPAIPHQMDGPMDNDEEYYDC